MDEKWAFVGKKQKNCDPDSAEDQQCGDHWDHVAYDPEHRLVLSVVSGKRTKDNTETLVQDVKARLQNKVPSLITTDEHEPYKEAILNAYHTEMKSSFTSKPARPKKPKKVPLPELNYATVCKTREKGRITNISCIVVFGTISAVMAAVSASKVSSHLNTAFVERQNGTDRNRNSRKIRKTYGFSKDWQIHRAVSYFTLYSYNFCWPVRTLRVRGVSSKWQNRSPAMAAGLSDHVWSIEEWLGLPAISHSM